MTNHSLPTGPTGPEGDSEKKQWGRKREQFDAVISTTRFNGAIDNLISGGVEVRTLLAILDELNASNQRGRYMAEVLALKQESRRLASVPFDARVAEFLLEGSRRIPFLSDGLASQLAVTLASAADNPAYLDTVNKAVSNLLLDVGRPLKTDTRNYLRALTDKIDASRRLLEARGHLATVPSVYPPAIPEPLVSAKFPDAPRSPPAAPQARSELGAELAAPVMRDDVLPRTTTAVLPSAGDIPHSVAGATPKAAVAPTPVLAVGQSADPSEDQDEYEDLEDTAVHPGTKPKPNLERTLMLPATGPADADSASAAAQPGVTVDAGQLPSAQAHTPSPADVASAEDAPSQLMDATATPEPITATRASLLPRHGTTRSASKVPPKRPAITSHGPIPVPSRRPAAPHPAPTSKQQRAAAALLGSTQTLSGVGAIEAEQQPERPPRERPISEPPDSLAIPTRGVPIWLIVVAASGVVLAAVGFWRLMRASALHSDEHPVASASASATAPGAASATSPQSRRTPKGVASAAAPPAPQPPAPPPPAPPPPAPPPPPPPAAAPPKAPPAAAVQAPAPRSAASPSVARSTAPMPIPKTPSAVTAPAPKPTSAKPATSADPAPAKPKATESATTVDPPVTPTTPKPSRTIDDILAELLRVPNDPAMIEAKAHEVARIVARSVRPEAEHILRRLIPEDVLAGSETVDTRVLEPVRRVVALLLKKVALDKDDSRAALAIDSLGEWAKLRKHGAAAKLTLDELAESPVVLSRPKRLQALERVQARLGIESYGE